MSLVSGPFHAMRRLQAVKTLLSVSLWFLVSVAIGGQPPRRAASGFTHVADVYRCIPKRMLEELPPFSRAHVMWPDAADLSRSQVSRDNDRVEAALESTQVWVRRVVRPEFVPGELQMIALKGGAGGFDVIRCRYEVGHTVIEIGSTASRLTLVIHREDRTEPAWLWPLKWCTPA